MLHSLLTGLFFGAGALLGILAILAILMTLGKGRILEAGESAGKAAEKRREDAKAMGDWLLKESSAEDLLQLDPEEIRKGVLKSAFQLDLHLRAAHVRGVPVKVALARTNAGGRPQVVVSTIAPDGSSQSWPLLFDSEVAP